MTSRHTNPIADAARTLSAAILALPAPTISSQALAEEVDALATWREEIGLAIASFDEDLASIAMDRGVKLASKHLISSADVPGLVCDLRDAACDLAADAPEPEYDRLTAADYGVGGIRI